MSEFESKDKLARNLYILPAFGTSAAMAYFSSYLAMLLTDIYMIPVVLAGILEAARSVIAWLAGPVFGTFLDRVTFKFGKYWHWIVIGVVVGTGANALTFILPSMSSAPEKLAFPVFLLGIAMALFGAFSATALVSVYPKLSYDPVTRSRLAIGQKIGRDGGKTLWGLIVPAMLIYFIAAGGTDAKGWASTAYIIGIFTIVVNIVYAIVLKGSSIEKQAIAEKNDAKVVKQQIPFKVVLKGLLSNKALLAMFVGFTIHKVYYFFQILTAAYYFKYVAANFGSLGLFMTSFNLSAVVGSIFGGLIWIKIFKDSKRSFVAAGCVHLLFLLVLTLFNRGMSVGTFIIFVGCASFFAGTLEAYLMPMFAAAADWHAWKTGERADGLTMSVYSLTVQVSITVSTLLRTALLAWAGYNAVAYAQGAAPSANVISVLINFQTLYPLLLGVVAFGIIQIFYPLSDKKLKIIQEEIKAGRVGEMRNESSISTTM